MQLERDIARQNPFTQSFADIAHVKLNSDLIDNTGWGWNVGLMAKPFEALSIGATYRSHIKVDYDGTAVFIQRFTGDQTFDALVAAQLPQGEHPVTTSIDFPASINIGAGIHLGPEFIISLEADWTEWSKFSSLNVAFTDLVGRDIHRNTLWTDTWAYRVGLEKKFGSFAIRAGYYYDNTPQPTFDVGPLLSDNDRNVYSAGLGWDTERWGFDIGALLIKFRDRDVTQPPQTDNFFATYSETGLVLSAGFRLNF